MRVPPVFALPAAAMAVGVALFGAWGVVGAAAGVAAAFLIHRLGAGPVAVALAATLPPLTASGPVALAPAVVLGLAAASEHFRSPWPLAASALGLLLPGPAAWMVPALGGAALLATAPWPRALLGVVVAAASVLVEPTAGAVAAAGGLGVAALARSVARHPANLTMAENALTLGLVAAPAPALAAFVLAAAGIQPGHVWGVLEAALLAGVIGGAFLVAHAGLAVSLRSASHATTLLSTLTWSVPVLGLALFVHSGARIAVTQAAALLGCIALATALGGAWAWSIARSTRVPERLRKRHAASLGALRADGGLLTPRKKRS